MTSSGSEPLTLPNLYKSADENRIGLLYFFSLFSGAVAAGFAAYGRFPILEAAEGQTFFDPILRLFYYVVGVSSVDVPPEFFLDTSSEAWQLTFWINKLLFAGPIPYAIIALTISGIIYIVLLALIRSMPWYLSYFATRRMRKELQTLRPGEVGSPSEFFAKVYPRSRGNRWLSTRFQLLQRVWAGKSSRADLHDANDRYTAYQEALVVQASRPLVNAEWALPILGFIGTIIGVTEAVEGLRLAVNVLFEKKSLTKDVIDNFDLGFQGLIFAFDTTLFGLIGLLIVGTLSFIFQKGAMAAILATDRWTGEAINLLPDEHKLDLLLKGLFELDEATSELALGKDGAPTLRLEEYYNNLQRGLFEHDEHGNLTLEQSVPVLRSTKWLRDVLASLAVTDVEAELERDQDGRPVPRWKAPFNDLLTGLFEVDDKGELKRDSAQQPVPRLKRWLDLLLAEFFFLDGNGQPVRDGATGMPRSKNQAWREWMMRTILLELYELSDEEMDRISEGASSNRGKILPRSKIERRNREMIARLETALLLLAEIAKRGGGEGGQGAPDQSGNDYVEIAPANGAAVQTLAVDERRIVISRPEHGGAFQHQINVFEMKSMIRGGPIQSLQTASINPADRPDYMILSGDRLVYVDAKIPTICTLTIDGNESNQWEQSLDSRGKGNFYPLLVDDSSGIRRVATSYIEPDGSFSLSAAPIVDVTDNWVQILQALPGRVTAAGTLPGGALAIAVVIAPAGELIVVEPSGNIWTSKRFPLPWTVQAIACDHKVGEPLWACGESGQLARIELSEGEVSEWQLGRNFVGLAVANSAQLLAIERDSGTLYTVDRNEPIKLTHAGVDKPATVLTAAPHLSGVAIGFADGSADLWLTAGRRS